MYLKRLFETSFSALTPSRCDSWAILDSKRVLKSKIHLWSGITPMVQIQVFWKGHTNLNKIFHFFWRYWVDVKTSGRFFQIFFISIIFCGWIENHLYLTTAFRYINAFADWMCVSMIAVSRCISLSKPDLGNVHIIRQHIFGPFLTHPPT